MAQVIVRGTNNVEKVIDVSKDETAESLRQKIKESFNVLNDDFKVQYASKLLQGTSTLTDYNLFNVSQKPTLHLIDANIKGGF